MTIVGAAATRVAPTTTIDRQSTKGMSAAQRLEQHQHQVEETHSFSLSEQSHSWKQNSGLEAYFPGISARKSRAWARTSIISRRLDSTIQPRRTCAASYDRYMRHLIIDPRSSVLIGPWDMVTAFALIFTTFITPYEVALMAEAADMALYWTNRLVDLIFLTDLLLQFVLAYQVGRSLPMWGACCPSVHCAVGVCGPGFGRRVRVALPLCAPIACSRLANRRHSPLQR